MHISVVAEPSAARCQRGQVAAGPGGALRRTPSTISGCPAPKRAPRIPSRAPGIGGGTRARRAAARGPGFLPLPGGPLVVDGDATGRSARTRPGSRSTCRPWPRCVPAPPTLPEFPVHPGGICRPPRGPNRGRSVERPGERATTSTMVRAAYPDQAFRPARVAGYGVRTIFPVVARPAS